MISIIVWKLQFWIYKFQKYSVINESIVNFIPVNFNYGFLSSFLYRNCLISEAWLEMRKNENSFRKNLEGYIFRLIKPKHRIKNIFSGFSLSSLHFLSLHLPKTPSPFTVHVQSSLCRPPFRPTKVPRRSSAADGLDLWYTQKSVFI